ncbi:MAG TPA: dipeptidase [Terriglobia bacterium]|nr:dipeptidase [Terriglobia bacterium]
MKKLFLAHLAILVAAACLSAAQRSAAEARQVTEQALRHAIIIDTHADTPQMMLDEGYDLASPASPYMISIPKMRKGHLGAEFFSIWVPVEWPSQDLVHRALDLIDVVDEQVARHSDTLGLAHSAADVVRLRREHKIAILMGLEGGHIIINDLRVLDNFYRLGVRYMTLTHTRDTDWADSSGDKPRHNGLTPFGRSVVARMNRLGMMVDISHVSDKTFYDAVAASKAPMIASHSSCRALCDAPRDMTDDMIRALAKNGGVIDINYYSGFVDSGFHSAQNKISKQVDAAVDAARQQRALEGKRLTYAEENVIRRKMEAHLPKPSYQEIADHIDHAVKVGGIDHVGLGSDFDGVDAIPRGMEDVSQLPNLVAELARRGYSEKDLEKILGGNVLRVMREVARVSREMQAGGSSQ